MTVSPPVERVTPVGPLRAARPGSFRQLLGAPLSAVAALVILFLVLGGVVQVADNMAFLCNQRRTSPVRVLLLWRRRLTRWVWRSSSARSSSWPLRPNEPIPSGSTGPGPEHGAAFPVTGAG